MDTMFHATFIVKYVETIVTILMLNYCTIYVGAFDFFKKIPDVHTVELEKISVAVRIPFHPLIDRPIYATNQASSTVLMET